MHIKSVYLRNFRNIKELTLCFSEKINEIIGENAQGKTSLLEALAFCSTGTSFRTNSIKELIHHGSDGFFIEVVFDKQGITSRLAVSYDGKKKQVFLNAKPSKPLVLLGLLHGVCATPDDSALVKGSPSIRRRFLDMQIAQMNPLYVSIT